MFLLTPARQAYDEAYAELQFARSVDMQVRMEVMAVPGLRNSIAVMAERLELQRERHTPFFHTEILVDDFTQFLINNGMEAHDSVMLRNTDTQNRTDTDDLHRFTIDVETRTPYISIFLLLADYVNSVYSYRLTEMNLSGDVGKFTVEAVLR
jgi:hypothetical protein